MTSVKVVIVFALLLLSKLFVTLIEWQLQDLEPPIELPQVHLAAQHLPEEHLNLKLPHL